MTNPALTAAAAAERLITLPGFRWMPGMVDVDSNRVAGTNEDAVMECYCETLTLVTAHNSQKVKLSLPDLTDPATLGCVERMVEEVWKHPICPLQCTGHEGFDVFEAWLDDETFASGRTKIECLVNALAAAAGAA